MLCGRCHVSNGHEYGCPMVGTEDSIDPTTYIMQGYAAQARGTAFFRVPLISHIDGNLWTGGCVQGVPLPEDFDYVISLYPWEQYKIDPGTQRTEFKLYDGSSVDADQFLEIAWLASECIDAGKTLVHCQAGLNRSGLVAGMALVIRGHKPWDALQLMQEKRSDQVLCNQVFREHLMNFRWDKNAGNQD